MKRLLNIEKHGAWPRPNGRCQTAHRLPPARCWIAAGLLAFSFLLDRPLHAQSQARETDVEAVYLLNFARFMELPSHKNGAFTIGILGADPFGKALDDVTANEQVNGRSMKVVRLASAADARGCDIVFVSNSEAGKLDQDLAALGDANVLTVSTVPNFLAHGGMIQFATVAKRVRFAVNLDAVRRCRVALSSQLLKVAVSVTGAQGREGPQ